jgi:hypothetical protein
MTDHSDNSSTENRPNQLSDTLKEKPQVEQENPKNIIQGENKLVIDFNDEESISEKQEAGTLPGILNIDIDDEKEVSEKATGDVLTITLSDLQEDTTDYPGLEDQPSSYHNPNDEIYPDKNMMKVESSLASQRKIIIIAIAGIVGGILAWLGTELLPSDTSYNQEFVSLIQNAALYASLVGAAIGMALGTAYGIAAGNVNQAARSALSGLLFGGIGGVIGGSLAQYIYGTILLSYLLGSFGQLILRAVGWSILGLFIGVGQGALVPVKAKIRNGIIGGALGGLLGGAAFQLILSGTGEALLGRGLALAVMGLSIGILVSLVEEASKEAWLQMKTGPLAGKQFIIYEDRTIVGSNPSSHIVLIKDTHVLPEHAVIMRLGADFYLNKASSGAKVLVNGRPINRHNLANGDILTLGSSIVTFHIRSGKV